MSDYDRYANEPSPDGVTLEERQRRLENEYWESTAHLPQDERRKLYHGFCSEQDRRTLAEIADRQKQFLADARDRWEDDKGYYGEFSDDPDEWGDLDSVLFCWNFNERETWLAMFGDISGYNGWGPPVCWEKEES